MRRFEVCTYHLMLMLLYTLGWLQALSCPRETSIHVFFFLRPVFILSIVSCLSIALFWFWFFCINLFSSFKLHALNFFPEWYRVDSDYFESVQQKLKHLWCMQPMTIGINGVMKKGGSGLGRGLVRKLRCQRNKFRSVKKKRRLNSFPFFV